MASMNFNYRQQAAFSLSCLPPLLPYLFVFRAVLGFETQALYLLGMLSTT
jgi:hypothetical protein